MSTGLTDHSALIATVLALNKSLASNTGLVSNAGISLRNQALVVLIVNVSTCNGLALDTGLVSDVGHASNHHMMYNDLIAPNGNILSGYLLVSASILVGLTSSIGIALDWYYCYKGANLDHSLIGLVLLLCLVC